MRQRQGGLEIALARQIGLQIDGGADPAANLTHLVALETVALEAAFFGDHGPHHSQIGPPLDLLHIHPFLLALFKGAQRLGLPCVGGVLRIEQLQAGDMPHDPVLVGEVRLQFAQYVSRVHQGQRFAAYW